MDSRRSSEPIYRRMYNDLAAGIRAGRYAIGAALPTERELCVSFGVSRHTAREALRHLEERGLISRRQGSGSTVLARTPPVRYEQNIQSIDDLVQQGNASRLEVLSAEPALRNSAPGFAPRPPWRPLTKFEQRGLKLGHAVHDLVFVRREAHARVA